VRGHDALANLETEPDPSAVRAIRLPEPIEHMLAMLDGNARNAVGHGEANLAITWCGGDDDATARRRELDRVADQVLEHLEAAIVVGSNRRQFGRQLDAERDRCRRREQLLVLDRVVDE
jgi:hypothetical protein